ncbi:MAG: tetratricopeptide repeat protein [Myxococcales bacterium]|nr:tetratricopeptide repeat protein [Myxococcales bacterium]
MLSAALLASFVVAEPSALPLRKLRLYETGVGYFERRGNVGPADDLALPLPSSHLDDALKSLVILEATGGVKVSGLDFGSAVSQSMARAMAGLPAAGDDPLAYDDLLKSLKGSRVQITSDEGKIRGRFVDLEGPFFAAAAPARGTVDDAGTPVATPRGEPHYTLIVLDDDDALRRIKTDHVQAIRVLDERTAARLDVAATSLSDQSARQATALSLQVGSAGRLGLGYVSEAPVWRTTYRVVMEHDVRQGQLQAWALVHNDTDEDWDSVMVELANGRPSSFLHPLAAPRYAERELVAPPDGLTTVPQLANRTVDGMLEGTAIGEAFGVGGLGLVGTGRGGGGTGEGTIGLGMIGTIGTDSGGVTLGDLAELAKAAGTESGALFLYRVADPIDLQAHHSALLPIVQQEVEVEPITFFAVGSHEGLSAARLVNTTAQTLPPGTVSFFADGGFVGEAMFDRLKPEERRFVPYGFELDLELDRVRKTIGEQVTALRWNAGAVVESFVLESELTLRLDNRSGRGRRVYVALDVPRRADLQGDGAVELDYDLASDTALAATTVEGKSQAVHTLRVKELQYRRHEPELAALVALHERDGVAEPQREVLQASIERLRRAEELDQHIADAERAIERIERTRAMQKKLEEAVRTAHQERRANEAQTRVEQAAAMLQQAEELDAARHAPGPLNRARQSLSNAFDAFNQGRYAEAEPNFRRALEIQREVYGPGHPRPTISMDNLALCLQAQGRNDAARELHLEALELRSRGLAPDHPDTGLTRNNLGWDYMGMKDADTALEHFTRAQEIFEKAYGPDHPRVAMALESMALAEAQRGHHPQAEALHRRALEIRRKALGNDHPNVALSLSGLGSLAFEQGRHDEAIELLEQARAILTAREGAERYLGDVLTSLGQALLAVARHDEARVHLERALELRQAGGGFDPAVLAKLRLYLAQAAAGQGQREEAKAQIERGLEALDGREGESVDEARAAIEAWRREQP